MQIAVYKVISEFLVNIYIYFGEFYRQKHVVELFFELLI